tara:strand:+ start:141 stop:551 length:411 start_codon:yes stop_codon:yes gene_type:complete
MIFEIKTVRNGCTVTIRPSDEGDHWAFEGDDSATFVVQEGYVDEFEAWRALLLELLETYGPAESRSAEKRLYVTVAPGNRHPSFVDTLYYDYEHPPNQDDQGVDWDGVAYAFRRLPQERAKAVRALLEDGGNSGEA